MSSAAFARISGVASVLLCRRSLHTIAIRRSSREAGESARLAAPLVFLGLAGIGAVIVVGRNRQIRVLPAIDDTFFRCGCVGGIRHAGR